MNAVFERDFVAYSASPRFQWLRFAFAAVMGALLLACVVPGHLSRDFSSIGTSIFGISVLAGFGLAALTVPGSFATVLVHARAGSTLPVLLTTPLSPLSIAGGAYLARMATFLVLVLATWPPIALSLSYGGVRGSQFFSSTATILATGLLVAAPSFIASAYARRTTGAVVGSYLISMALLAGLYVAGPTSSGGPGFWQGAAYSPVHALLATRDTSFTPPAADAWGPFLLLAWTSALSGAAIVLVAWRIAREGRGTADESRTAALSGRTCRPLRHENPLLDREMHAAGILRRGAAGRGLFGFLVASEIVFLVLAHTSGEPRSLTLHFGLLGLQGFFLVLAVTAAGATLLAAEREGRTLDLLRCTPLTPREIVIGKLAGLLRGFAPCLAVPAVHLLIGWALGVFSPLSIPFMALCGAAALSAWAVFGLSQSLDQANPNRAVMRTMGAFGILGVLVALNVGFPLRAAFQGADVERWIGDASAFGANPVALMFLPAAALRIGGSDATITNVPPPSAGDMAIALVACALWIALYAGFGTLVYRRLFNMYRTRVDG